MSRHDCDLWPDPAGRTMAEIMQGVPEPVGAVRACPDCGRTWVVYQSTSPISRWVFRAWRPERWWQRRARRWRERKDGNDG